MLLKHFVILVVFLLLINSCGLVQPKDPPKKQIPNGSIFVTSNILGARIFIDSDTTGQITPDTVKNKPVGFHTVQVFKDGYIITPDSIAVNVVTDSITPAHFSLEFITNQGKLFFDSTPDGAEILVNGGSAGKFTPDTVIVAAGTYNFGLYKNGFHSLEIGNIDVVTNSLSLFNETLIVEKQVLIESFANSSCKPCTTTNAHIENFIASHNPNHYSLIEYFANWPNPADPMFHHNPIGNNARFGSSFYNVKILPEMFIEGNAVDAKNYSDILSIYNSERVNAGQDISVSLSRQDTADSLRVKVELNEFNVLPAGDWRLFIAVIEKEVSFSEPPGSNGLSKFVHVFRRFLTDENGDIFTFSNNKFEKRYMSLISSEWDIDEIQIVGFIQNINTKKVIQSSHL